MAGGAMRPYQLSTGVHTVPFPLPWQLGQPSRVARRAPSATEAASCGTAMATGGIWWSRRMMSSDAA